jgi:leader peptidase (prepilin peptidase)/N-methyltransferase
MTTVVTVLCALLGVPGGMFANLLIDRVPDRQSLRPLPALETLTRGVRQVLVIVVTVALFAGAALRFDGGWVVPAYLVFFLCLISITVIDADRQIIPNWIIYPTIFTSIPLLALAALAGDDWDRFGDALIGAAAAWTTLFLIHMISPAGMGFGDVRLSFVLGLFLGWISLLHVFTGMFLGVLIICAFGIVLAVLRLRSLKKHMAFGPFLALGSTLAVFAGEAINRWWRG